MGKNAHYVILLALCFLPKDLTLPVSATQISRYSNPLFCRYKKFLRCVPSLLFPTDSVSFIFFFFFFRFFFNIRPQIPFLKFSALAQAHLICSLVHYPDRPRSSIRFQHTERSRKNRTVYPLAAWPVHPFHMDFISDIDF